MKNKAITVFVLCSLFLVPTKAQEVLNYPLDTINGEEVYRYVVEQSIGLYRIGVNFNVPQSEIVRFNPQLRERGLHFGETLLIPTGRKVEARRETVKPVVPVVKDTVIPVYRDTVIPKDTIIPPDTTAIDSVQGEVIELALLLPFESKQAKRTGNADRMLEFYQGALLALKDLQRDSVTYRLRVYDTERSEEKVNALCDSTELDHVRGILGPVYPIQIERVASWCELHHVPLLLPFTDDTDLTGYHQVYQFNSPDLDEARVLAQWIANREDRHVVFVDHREYDITPSMKMLRDELKAQQVPYSTLSLRDLLNDSVWYAVDSFQENIFILYSDRFQQIRMLLPHIAKINVKLLLVSQYAWQKEQISMPQVYTSKFNSDADRTAYDEAWEKNFLNKHVSDLPRYDLLGYDLMRELVHIIRHEDGEQQPLQSPIVWESNSEQDGWQNTYIRVVEK